MLTFRSRSSPLPPQNRHGKEFARNQLSFLSNTIQQSINNSIDVNAFPSYYYTKIETGVPCTCSRNTLNSPFNSEGNATPEHLATLLTGSSIAINEYTTRPNEILPTPPTPNVQSLDIQEPFTTPFSFTESPSTEVADVGLSTANSSACGICLGTGFVGGYSLTNGSRYILDTTYPTATGSFLVNQNSFPHSFALPNSGMFVNFLFNFPRYCELIGVRLMNNTVPVLTGTLTLNNTDLYTWINSQSFPSTTQTITVSNVPVFTHLELTFSGSPLLPVAYPQFTQTGDLAFMDAISEIDINIGSDLPSSRIYDLIVDTKLNKVWRLTASTSFVDNFGNIYGWNCRARLVQPYEIFSSIWTPANQGIIRV